jgi:hypothetical protein
VIQTLQSGRRWADATPGVATKARPGEIIMTAYAFCWTCRCNWRKLVS